MSDVHKATITITSVGDSPSVEVELDWQPGLDEFDPRELGYEPAAFMFMELAHRVGIEAPIIEAVADVVAGTLKPKDALERLMKVSIKAEI